MHNCEQLLIESIKTYQKIGNCYGILLSAELNNNNSDKIAQQVKLIHHYSEQVKGLDDQLQNVLTDVQQSEQLKQLIMKRTDCIQSLISNNKTLSARAKSISALLKHEFSNLAKNNTAINQYNQSISSKKKSIFTKSY